MKKCLVLDLDNTLWGGVVGEEGLEGIQLSLGAPGNSFVAFQQALLDHHNRGVILAINSRNNPDDAWEVIRSHPNMILKENNFAAARMNWQDKAQNLRELAEELNIGLDSMVFLDDDQTNRALVRAVLPEVEVPEMPQDPSEYARFLNGLGYFSGEALTDEDKMRGNLYVTERLRREQEKQYPDKEEFLMSLGLELTFYQDDASAATRLAQMTEKTNQFNTNKIPFADSDVQDRIKSEDAKVFHARLNDKFGDYGIIIMAIITVQNKKWHIESMLMSCRVFGRGVEDAFLALMVRRAAALGVESLTAEFVETPKNIPAKEFMRKYFPDGACAIDKAPQVPAWITVYENI